MAAGDTPEETTVSDRGMVPIPASLRQRHDIAVDLRSRLTDSAGFELVHSS
ncbi:hypothetical protein [Halopenitus persicus]|uniref:hypothetical protein n=1 Tax=Halopenitus persicus TaxID=1048396 RepID=UPI00155F64A1|nr:hypothetical protein [Halopenitus persicus]